MTATALAATGPSAAPRPAATGSGSRPDAREAPAPQAGDEPASFAGMLAADAPPATAAGDAGYGPAIAAPTGGSEAMESDTHDEDSVHAEGTLAILALLGVVVTPPATPPAHEPPSPPHPPLSVQDGPGGPQPAGTAIGPALHRADGAGQAALDVHAMQAAVAQAETVATGTTDTGGDAFPAIPLAADPVAPLAPAPRSVAPVTMPLALPADPQAGFDDGFGERIVWMAGQRVDHARIQLNPEHAGPIDVRVQIDGERVVAEFQSNHVEVRQAIESSLPRLREMLGQHGLQLAQADVGQRQARDRDDRAPPAPDADGPTDDAASASTAGLRPRRQALVDAYA